MDRLPAVVWGLFTLLLMFRPSPDLQAFDSSRNLQLSVARLNIQLGSGDVAEGWRKYLQLNRLEAQAAKGLQADLATLVELHRLIDSHPSGHEFQPFADVRLALEDQINTLSQATDRSIEQLLADALVGFRPISISRMQQFRAQARLDLIEMINFYRQYLNQENFDNLANELGWQDTLDTIDGIEFVLAPEVSEGSLNSQINELREQLQKIERQIDALPTLPDRADQQAKELEQGQDGVQALAKQRQTLQEQIRDLTTQRNEVRRQDLPRKRQRAESLRALLQAEARLEEVEKKLGDPYLTTGLYSLGRFTRVYAAGTEDNLEENYLRRLQRLAEDLPRLTDIQDRRSFGFVGNAIEWLENADQAPALVAALRSRYALPNGYLSVSGAMLNRLGSRPVNETRPVREEVKDRIVQGYAYTSGTVKFDLIDDPDQIHVSVHSLNQIFTDTFVEQGPLKIFVQGNGMAEARRSVLVSAGGFLSDDPYAAANIDNRLCGTSSDCNLINRVVDKKFQKEKNENDIRASSQARKELFKRFSEETEKAFADGRQSLTNAKNKNLARYSKLPNLFAYTQNEQINLVARRFSNWNLAAPNLPMQLPHSNDIDVRIHETLATNYLEPLFRGKTYTNDELADLFKESFQSDGFTIGANEGKADQDPVPFSITFSNVRPVQFQFEENRFEIVVSATRFTQERRSINAGLTITIRFKIVEQDGELFLFRDGPADLDYIEGQEKSAELVGFRSMLNTRLNPENQEEFEKIPLPDNLLPLQQVDALKDRPEAKNILLSQCRLDAGWLYLGWNYQEPSSLQRPVDLPAISFRTGDPDRSRQFDSAQRPMVRETFRD